MHCIVCSIKIKKSLFLVVILKVKIHLGNQQASMPTLSTWYHTEVPPKSIWKSVKLSFTPMRQYFCTSGREYVQSSGRESGHTPLHTQLISRTTPGTCTRSDNLAT